jgi:hypothetical protein
MRIAAQPVKLQFDNVGQFRILNPHLMHAGARRHPRTEKHRKHRHIRANRAVSKKPECGLNCGKRPD